MIPDFLTHYYEASRGPFRSLTALDPAEADRLQEMLCQAGIGFASKRAADYLDIRRGLERKIRALFVNRNGQPQNWNPDGKLGPDRYIEAQVWSDEPLKLLGWLP
jgi:hypothetical protein